jgi:hypothetical protein
MAGINSFLADQLVNPNIAPGRTVPVFQDNRPKTVTPVPYIETIIPGKSGAQGRIGVYQGSTWIPEVGAYIYIYINGFLVNPPILNPDGTLKNTDTSVVSNKKGEWSTTTHFFSVLPEFEYGQTIVFRAKAPLKQMSDRSVPYAIGATPAPVNMGVIGDFGVIRNPYEGEYSIMGRVSYWFNHLTGLPNFDCNNHIYVYVNGIHAGTYNNVLGEVFRNEIRGTDVAYPISVSLENRSLFLLVDDQPIEVHLKNLSPLDSTALLGKADGLNSVFWFLLPTEGVIPKIFRNGLRQAEGIDYTYSVDSPTKKGTVIFASYSIPEQGDDLIAVFQYHISEFVIGEFPSGIIDGSNTDFYLTQKAKILSLEVYVNGLHLVSPADYSFNANTKITLTNAPQPGIYNNVLGDIILVDYQIISSADLLVVSEIPTQSPDKTKTDEYTYKVLEASVGKPNVFKNGIRLKEGNFNDYISISPNIIKFTPWALPNPDVDTLIVTFYTCPIVLSKIIDYLNSTQEFANYCLTATTVGTEPIPDSESLVGLKNNENKRFSLPESDLQVNYKIFKNGLRQKEHIGIQSLGDYTIDYINKEFIFDIAPSPQDDLVVLLNYVTTNYVIGETPFGVKNGTNRSFTLSMLPKEKTVSVYFNGIRLNPFNQTDYKIQGKNIVFLSYIPIAQDILIVDYEPAYGQDTFTSSILIPANGSLNYSFKTLVTNTAMNVFVNGVLQQKPKDYNSTIGSITFVSTPTQQVPQTGDIIIIEFILTDLFKTNPRDQLKIVSPYKLDIKRYKNDERDFVQRVLFGDDVILYPGKDIDGEFYFWFNRKTGYWKWSWIDPESKEITSFVRGQRITARAWNSSNFTYTIPR